ncbi:MAG: 2-dehydropantoate 2-reductase [Spirochaetaceae bacterium]|nr:2-dehydropantoate 2-reductase [Spirochaetaceae bacterium]
MNIAIIGAGATGSLFGSYLSHAGYNVIITNSSETKTNVIADKGIKVLSPSGEEILHTFLYEALPVSKLGSSEKFKNCQYYIFCVKSFSTASAAESIYKFVKPDSIVVTLQNGAGNIENLSAFFKLDNIAAGTTTEGATLLEPGIVIHGGKGKTTIGMVGNNKEKSQLEPLITAFEKAGFNTSYTDDPKKIIWEKLAINAAINPITAILKASNGIIVENEYLKNLVKIITEEVCLTASASAPAGSDNIKLDPDETYNKVLEVAKNTKANKSSMLQDILAGKKTEIENISGFISKTAEDNGISAKGNHALFLLVKALENKTI